LENLVQARINDLGGEIVAAGAKMRNRFYHIDDSPSLISSQILLRAQRLQMKMGKPLDLIVVDYIQKLRDPGDNQNQRVQEISGNIKHAARVLNCPIVALSQLSRDCEKRQDKRPMLSDLRDSGSLEQDADIVMFVYRDEVYDKNSNLSGIAEVLVRKNRNGRTGDCSLTSRLQFARFENFTGIRPEQNKRSYGLE
jgi:replicative DNA helicase